MLDPKSLDDMARRLANNLPPGLRDLQQETEKNIRAALQGTFSRLDLVTREEFDAQAKVLARTRAHIDTLEARLAALEAELKAKTGGKSGAESGNKAKSSKQGGTEA